MCDIIGLSGTNKIISYDRLLTGRNIALAQPYRAERKTS